MIPATMMALTATSLTKERKSAVTILIEAASSNAKTLALYTDA